MNTWKVLVELEIEAESEGEAIAAVNQALDFGVLQDCINDDDDNHVAKVVSAVTI